MPQWLTSLGGIIVTIVALKTFHAGVIAFSEEDGIITEELIDPPQHEPVPLAPQNAISGTTQCCRNPDLENANYLYVSTMDGRLHALDATNGGRVVWVADFDAEELLCGTLGKVQPMQVDGRVFNLVPALDGTLYMYSRDERLLEPIPLSTDLLLQASIRVGHDAVAGGRTISTTGVDPLTGEVRYHCSSSQCDSVVHEPVLSTLVFRRSTSKVRAVDALTGHERWNLSVSEYDATLVMVNNGKLYPGVTRSNFIVKVSLFNTENIHTLSLTSERSSTEPLPHSESLFYLGTVNDEPFIMHSTRVKNEMKKIARNLDFSEPSPSSGQLTRSGKSYFVEQGTVDDLLSASYKRSFAAQQARKTSKEITNGDSYELQVVANDQGRNSHSSISCPVSDSTALIGEKDIRSAAFSYPENGNQGWFVLRPNGRTKRRSLFGSLLDSAKCSSNIVDRVTGSFRVDQMVSGWWRIMALAMLGVVGSATVVRAETRSTSVGPSVDTGSSLTPSPGGQVGRQRKTTSTHESCSETFHSKFLQDFEPIKLLGHGGFGVVFEARNRLDECPYAVKRIAVANSERAIQRVLREVRAMAKLDHPQIIRYYHTWIERPPDGWQEEEDSLMLKGMQTRSKLEGLADELTFDSSSSSENFPVPAPLGQSSLRESLDIAPPLVHENTDDGSWLEDSNVSEKELSDSSSDSEEPVVNDEVQLPVEKSESIVFDGGASGDGPAKTNEKKLSQIGKKMVLVTSTDEDLMASRNASNFVYIYIQMQLCQEQTLHAWLSGHRSWDDRPLDKMKVWLGQMCSAVSYIHQQGLIHRDIKPQNIFFASDEALKIGDLGLVTRCVPAEDQPIEKSVNRLGIHTDNVGTRGYMSPEQLDNKPYTFKVDVFSLGLIYCELVIPFQTLMERSLTLSGLQQGRVSDALASLHPDERNFIGWLTKMNPDERPTCDEVLDSDYMVGVETRILMSNNASGIRRRVHTDASLLNSST
ncbi:unnamed protein product [Nippostrongylus brasiliensis]|uniref:PRKR-like endoplasmic reticulum kinase n=1 Tax=Nippostrongylus brasiliensis TaxID=27835 RepID=A0A0N4XZL4_NIPBR|nr:unnamed protein product [Nippostrongylus brasiliensis]